MPSDSGGELRSLGGFIRRLNALGLSCATAVCTKTARTAASKPMLAIARARKEITRPSPYLPLRRRRAACRPIAKPCCDAPASACLGMPEWQSSQFSMDQATSPSWQAPQYCPSMIFTMLMSLPPALNSKAEIAVAHLAAKANAVEPVREHHGTHAGVLRVFVQDDVRVFCFGLLRRHV